MRRLLVVTLLVAAAGCGGDGSGGAPSEHEWPAVSRDGRRIAFTSEGAVYAMRRGGAARRITDPGNEIDAFPDWSPDGSKIVFSRAGKGQFDPWRLYVVNADGSGLRQLTTEGSDLSPSWFPDGDTIAFERFDLAGPTSMVYEIHASGGRERLLLRNAGQPAWSPDGSKLAFVRGGTFPDAKAVAVFDTKSGLVEQVARSRAKVAEDPAWSPDGRRIAFADTPGAYPDLFVVDADGTGLRRLTTHSNIDRSPTWTPDGRIVFASDREGGPSQLYVLHPDRAGARRFR